KMKFVKVLLIVSCAIGATNLGAQSAAGVVHRSGARAGKSSIRKLTWLAGPGIVDLSDPFEPSLAVHGRSTLLAWPEELRTGVWRLWTASRTLPWQSWGDRVDVDNSAQPWLTRMMTGPDGLTSLAWGRRDNSRQESVMVRLMARGSGRWGRVTTLATMFGPENSFTGLADVRVWVQPTGAVTVAWMYDFTVGHSDYVPIYERTLSPRTGRWGHRVTVASNSDGVLFSLTGARDGELTACFQDFVTTLAPGASKWSALLDISVKGWTFELGGYDEAAVSNLDGTTVAAWSVYTSGGTAPQGYGLYVSVRQAGSSHWSAPTELDLTPDINFDGYYDPVLLLDGNDRFLLVAGHRLSPKKRSIIAYRSNSTGTAWTPTTIGSSSALADPFGAFADGRGQALMIFQRGGDGPGSTTALYAVTRSSPESGWTT